MSKDREPVRRKQTATNSEQTKRTVTGETKTGEKVVRKPKLNEIRHHITTKTGSPKTKGQYRDI